MRDVNTALYEFWKGFGLPAYRAGRVPDNAELPYITFEVSVGDALTETPLVAHSWHNAPGATAAAADMLDEVARRIPESGLSIPIKDRGFLVLYRNRGVWQQYVQDDTDKNVVGGQIRYSIHFHLM